MLVGLFSALVRLFFIHLSIFYRKMPSLDKRKFLFHYKETFSRMTEHTSLQKQIKQVFFRGITFRIYILETSKREDNRKKRKNQKVRSPFC